MYSTAIAYNVRYNKKIVGTRIIYSAGDYNFYYTKVQSSPVLPKNPYDGLRDVFASTVPVVRW